MDTIYTNTRGFWEITSLEVHSYYNKNCMTIYQVFIQYLLQSRQKCDWKEI